MSVPDERPFRIPVRRAPVETKVQLSTAGGALGGAVAALAIWLLGAFVWGGPTDAANGAYTASLVPSVVSGLVLIVVPGLTAFVGGYIGKHTARPDLANVDADI